MTSKILWTAVVALALSGCGHTEVHQVLLRVPSGPASRDPDLYLGEQIPQRPYYEMALIQGVGYGGDANLEDVTDALRDRGRFFGCDALIRVHVDQGYSMAHGFGICVKWATVQMAQTATPPPAAPPPATPTVPTTAPDAGAAAASDAGSDSGEVGF